MLQGNKKYFTHSLFCRRMSDTYKKISKSNVAIIIVVFVVVTTNEILISYIKIHSHINSLSLSHTHIKQLFISA